MLICEDRQHEVFVLRFLGRQNIDVGDVRVEMCSTGSGEQFVREQYTEELKALRRRHARTSLVVVLDGDRVGVEGRKRSLADACRSAKITDRALDGTVIILVPTWNIETWLAYLGGERVDESVGSYPRLDRESDCEHHVATLSEMCTAAELRQPAPASLVDACAEYERFKALAGRG